MAADAESEGGLEMFRQSLSGIGCVECGGVCSAGSESGLGIIKTPGMFTEHQLGLPGLRGLGDDAAVDTSGLDLLNALPDQTLDTLNQYNSLAPGETYSWSSNVPIGAVNTSTGQPVTATQIAALIAQAAGGANAVYKSTQSPYVIPGTNVVYNPATGQYANAAGIAAAGLGTSLGGMLPLLLIGLVVVMLGKK